MATIIDKMYADHKALHDLLTGLNETSLASDADNKLKKVLLVSAASYFEHEITTVLIQFVADTSQNHEALLALIRAKVISRQYHTYFQWEGKNANSFFGLFGEQFLTESKANVREQEGLDDSVRAFLEIGSNRNQMMHENFGTFPMEKTAEEVYELYKQAHLFVDYIRRRLGVVSKQGDKTSQ
ncbi:MAG TPA: HEPN domain-containing protein [Terriglobales bacterium]|nr:HEPN domain-containing protein [Terriglobales bacterium]